jgi:transcriptional regulator with XRE-family HTH domain
MELFNHRDAIGKNILTYLRLKGYSKSSFSKLADISRPTLNQILSGDSPSPKTFEDQINRITSILELPTDFFLTEPVIQLERWRIPMIQHSDRAPNGERDSSAKELLNDLDDLISMASLYL